MVNSFVTVRGASIFFFKQKTAYEMLRSLVGSEMCIRDRLVCVDAEDVVTGLKRDRSAHCPIAEDGDAQVRQASQTRGGDVFCPCDPHRTEHLPRAHQQRGRREQHDCNWIHVPSSSMTGRGWYRVR